MNSTRLATWISVVANIGVMIGLLFVAYQINQNTTQLRRAEMNATHEQISAWRHAIMENQGLAEIWEIASRDPKELSAAQRVRLDLTLEEIFWANFQTWDRARVGAIEGSMGRTAVQSVVSLIGVSASARDWWERRRKWFDVEFQKAVDAPAA
jgi:hypothetical protein